VNRPRKAPEVIRETYKGRVLLVTKGRERGTLVCTVNGYTLDRPAGRDEGRAMASLRSWIDLVDRDEVVDGGRWAAEMYAPGTYQLCPEGHPVAIGGLCRHSYCTARREPGGAPVSGESKGSDRS
jgi:hypothetical protein